MFFSSHKFTAMAEDSITIHTSDHPEPFTVNNFWLRDHCCCSECYNHDTKQRKIGLLDIPIDIKPSHYSIDGNELQITCKCVFILKGFFGHEKGRLVWVVVGNVMFDPAACPQLIRVIIEWSQLQLRTSMSSSWGAHFIHFQCRDRRGGTVYQ